MIGIAVSIVFMASHVFGAGELLRNLWKEDISNTHDGYVFNWYNVEPWEVDVCQKEAGVDADQEEYFATGLGGGEKRTYSLSTTVQAQYRPLENGTLYEIAWYIQPANTDLEYELYTMTSEGLKTRVQGRTSASQKTGDANFWSEVSSKNYTTVVLKYLAPEGEKTKEYQYVLK